MLPVAVVVIVVANIIIIINSCFFLPRLPLGTILRMAPVSLEELDFSGDRRLLLELLARRNTSKCLNGSSIAPPNIWLTSQLSNVTDDLLRF
jgi:hypothetical protein